MTDEERKLALYCLKASSDYHSEVCEECIKYPNCDHTIQDDVTETIIQSLEQEPCEDAVNRQAILNTLDNMDKALDEDRTVENYKELLKECYDVLPSVTPQTKKGHWIKDYDNSALDGLYHCSVCGRKLWIPKEESVSDYPYCHCGAEMESD